MFVSTEIISYNDQLSFYIYTHEKVRIPKKLRFSALNQKTINRKMNESKKNTVIICQFITSTKIRKAPAPTRKIRQTPLCTAASTCALVCLGICNNYYTVHCSGYFHILEICNYLLSEPSSCIFHTPFLLCFFGFIHFPVS